MSIKNSRASWRMDGMEPAKAACMYAGRCAAVIGSFAIAALLMMGLLITLTGCVFSDTITERVYDSNEDSLIDYDIDPVLVNSPTAEVTSDKLPKLAEDESANEDGREADKPKLANEEELATTTAPAPSLEYDPNAASRGDAEGGMGDSQADAGGRDDEGGSNEGGDDEDNKNPDDGDDGEGNDPAGDGAGDGNDGNGRKSGGSGDYYSDDPNYDDPEIPENINEIVAFGNYAVIASIIGGDESGSALIGCDAATKVKTASVLANRGMQNVKTVEYAEGTVMGDDAFNTLANEIVPDLVFITEGKNPFTETQMLQLADNRISVYPLPELTSDTRIRFAFQVIGRTLDQGGVEGAAANMQAYLDYCDGLIDRYTSVNGGVTGGFDFEEGVEEASGADVIMALYIDGWNEKARYSDPYDYLDSSNGVALATLGYGTSPLNYYWSVGGAVNSAAYGRLRTQQGSGIVWQISTELCKFGFNRWNSSSIASVDLSDYFSTGGAFSACLLSYAANNHYGVGTDKFPAVVVRDQRIQSLLKAASDQPHDLYYPYPTISPGGGTNVGYFTDTSKSVYVETCIGRDITNETVLNGKSLPVYVNPKGLCQDATGDTLCSWADGSAESVLEASWVQYRFRGGSEADFDAEVRNFYQQFYGYSVTADDLKAIKSGIAG